MPFLAASLPFIIAKRWQGPSDKPYDATLHNSLSYNPLRFLFTSVSRQEPSRTHLLHLLQPKP